MRRSKNILPGAPDEPPGGSPLLLKRNVKVVDSFHTLCYDVQEIKNLKESEVVMMEVMKNEIAIAYSMKTSVCAY